LKEKWTNKERKQKMKIKIILFIFAALVFSGCGKIQDPTELELAIGENIDIDRMFGEVVNLGTSYFVGDQQHTQDKAGEPYYWVALSYKNENNYSETRYFKGIPKEVLDQLIPGMHLPGRFNLILSNLAKEDGEIVDMYRKLNREGSAEEDLFLLVIKSFEGAIKKYEVDMMTYYRIDGYIKERELQLPVKLPLDIGS